jgi:hypothetical protein
MMDKFRDSKITVVNSDGKKIAFSLPWNADIYEWVDIFRTILKWLTFLEDNIKEVMPDEVLEKN